CMKQKALLLYSF
nr:immunoglobulin light chain junction region [Macaca mulatta]MOX87539.1 immunoglobulin light chain junction region [Macaca mulatta]